MKDRRPADRAIAALLFCVVLLVHASSPNVTSTDSAWAIHTAMSLVQQGNTDLDEYRDLIARTPDLDYTIESVNGHLYTPYPLGASLLAAPAVFAIDQLSAVVSPLRFSYYLKQTRPLETELFIASLLVALTAVILYQLARRFLDRRGAVLLVLIFAFCTSAWSTASRALWQHGPSMLMLAMALYVVVLALDRPQRIQYLSLPLAFSFVVRPTNSLSILVFTAYVLVCYRRYFLRYLLWSLPVVVPFLAFNLSLYHALLSTYYRSYQDFRLGADFGEALFGPWISPARGLLIYSPILIFSGWGLSLNLRRSPYRRVDVALLAIVALHCLVLAIWNMWWGGWSYGPRMLTDMLPYFMYWLIPVIAVLQSSISARSMPGARPWRERVLLPAFLTLGVVSLAIHARGATAPATFDWNRLPANIDEFPQRLWDLRDVQFLRGLHWGTPVDLAIAGVSYPRLGPEIYTRLGTTEVRAREFNAERALIAPPASSWLVVGTDQPIGPEIARLLEGLTQELESRTLQDGTTFRLLSGAPGARILAAAAQSQQTVAWSSKFLPAAGDIHTATLPVHFGDAASLLGFHIQWASSSGPISVTTYWQAGSRTSAPLSLFVHALDADGQVVAQEDRLDAPSEDWQPGDVIAQVHRLTLPKQAGALWIEIGLYDPDSGGRLPVLVDGQPVDHRVLLAW
jgi:hypothetical protein